MLKKGNLHRILLDLVMVGVIATLYSKNVISLLYHEAVGLALITLFLVHLVFNRKWIRNVITRPGMGSRLKLTGVIDVLLVISWGVVFVTGILVSKKIFPFHINALNPWHFFSAALALLLTGVHVGMHWTYLGNNIWKKLRIPDMLARVCIIAVILFGCFSLTTTSYVRWISAPFTSQQRAYSQENSDVSNNADNPGAAGRNQDVPGAAGTEGRQGYGDLQAGDGTQPQEGARAAGGAHGQQPFSLIRLLNVITGTFSIMFLIAAVTHGLDLLFQSRKKK